MAAGQHLLRGLYVVYKRKEREFGDKEWAGDVEKFYLNIPMLSWIWQAELNLFFTYILLPFLLDAGAQEKINFQFCISALKSLLFSRKKIQI